MTAGDYSRAFAGDQLGDYLITGFGQMEGFFVVDALVPPFGSSSEVQVTVGYPNIPPEPGLTVQVDSTDNFVFTDWGEFSVSLTGGQGGIPLMTLLDSQISVTPCVTDRIAPFVYGLSGDSPGEMTGYQIDPTTGALTQVPGSTYVCLLYTSDTTIQAEDTLTWTHGKHVIHAGFELFHYIMNDVYPGNEGVALSLIHI